MKRFICFAALVALLGGMALYPVVDDAEAQSRVKIKPFTTLYTAYKAYGADGNMLFTPSSSLRGFNVVMSSDTVWTTTPDLCTLTVYLESGDSTRMVGSAWALNPIEVNGPNVRVTGFRFGTDVTRGDATFAYSRVYITGWY